MNYKKFFGAGLTVVVILSSVTPVLAFETSGQNRANRITTTTRPVLLNQHASSTAQTRIQTNFCASLGKFSQTITTRLSDRTTQVNVRRTETQTTLSNNRVNRNTKLVKAVDTAQEKRTKNYTKLMEYATNDELKVAVEKFKTAVDAAIKARQATVKSANETFRTAVDGAMAERKGLIETATAEYKTLVDVAKATATEACKVVDADAVTIRTDFQNSLQQAQESFKLKKAEIEKLKVDLEPARAAHKEAINKAIQDFKTAMEVARAELKAAFLAYGEKLLKVNTTTPATE